MRKTILSAILTILIVSIANAQIVNIPDANFKAYLLGNTAINTNLDTEIQVSEAVAYTADIYCPNLNISDLTGIEAFTGITQLWCQGNLLTTINISANTNLNSLYCYTNSLTTLDLSSNLNLGWVDCATNQLTSLDVSTNTNLISLKCSYNQLTALNVSANVNLTEFFCRDNQLTTLNLANGANTNMGLFTAINNSNLTCIEVDDAAYSTTNWTNIDATASFSENCSGLNVNDLNEEILFSVYPNPVKDIIHFSGLTNVQLFSITGQFIIEIKNASSLDMSNQPAGIYYLAHVDIHGEITQRNKIVKE